MSSGSRGEFLRVILTTQIAFRVVGIGFPCGKTLISQIADSYNTKRGEPNLFQLQLHVKLLNPKPLTPTQWTSKPTADHTLAPNVF